MCIRDRIFSPRLEWKDGAPQVSCFRFHSPISELIFSSGTGSVTKLFKKYNVPKKIVDEVTMPDWTSFACVLIKREVFQNIGYLDEGYFMYYEDVDFCRRAREAGFGLVNVPSSHVVHLRGQSSGLKKLQHEQKRLPSYYYHSRKRYFTKFYGKAGFWAGNLCWLAGRSLSLIKEILFRKTHPLPAYQHIDIWKY
jgi:GT2 family glycosyltransferase